MMMMTTMTMDDKDSNTMSSSSTFASPSRRSGNRVVVHFYGVNPELRLCLCQYGGVSVTTIRNMLMCRRSLGDKMWKYNELKMRYTHRYVTFIRSS